MSPFASTGLRPALVTFGALALITGLAYPFAITGASKIAFGKTSSGSLIVQDGQVRGSALIGRATEDPRYFWGRLSAAADAPTNAPVPVTVSGGSNLSPANPALRQAAESRIAALRAADPGNTAQVPLDLVTASASGLDPHISPAGAEFQIGRVARQRGVEPSVIRSLVQQHTHAPLLGFLGERRVDVLALNLALDRMGLR